MIGLISVQECDERPSVGKIPNDEDQPDFEELQVRLHPMKRRLSRPLGYMPFDCLYVILSGFEAQTAEPCGPVVGAPLRRLHRRP